MRIISYALLTGLMTCSHWPADNLHPDRVPERLKAHQPKRSVLRLRLWQGLQVPWSIVWAPDGRMFFTERPGRVRVFVNGQLRAEPLITLTDVEPSGESGLMSLAFHPQFATIIFCTFPTPTRVRASWCAWFATVKLKLVLPIARS